MALDGNQEWHIFKQRCDKYLNPSLMGTNCTIDLHKGVLNRVAPYSLDLTENTEHYQDHRPNERDQYFLRRKRSDSQSVRDMSPMRPAGVRSQRIDTVSTLINHSPAPSNRTLRRSQSWAPGTAANNDSLPQSVALPHDLRNALTQMNVQANGENSLMSIGALRNQERDDARLVLNGYDESRLWFRGGQAPSSVFRPDNTGTNTSNRSSGGLLRQSHSCSSFNTFNRIFPPRPDGFYATAGDNKGEAGQFADLEAYRKVSSKRGVGREKEKLLRQQSSVFAFDYVMPKPKKRPVSAIFEFEKRQNCNNKYTAKINDSGETKSIIQGWAARTGESENKLLYDRNVSTCYGGSLKQDEIKELIGNNNGKRPLTACVASHLINREGYLNTVSRDNNKDYVMEQSIAPYLKARNTQSSVFDAVYYGAEPTTVHIPSKGYGKYSMRHYGGEMANRIQLADDSASAPTNRRCRINSIAKEHRKSHLDSGMAWREDTFPKKQRQPGTRLNFKHNSSSSVTAALRQWSCGGTQAVVNKAITGSSEVHIPVTAAFRARNH